MIVEERMITMAMISRRSASSKTRGGRCRKFRASLCRVTALQHLQ